MHTTLAHVSAAVTTGKTLLYRAAVGLQAAGFDPGQGTAPPGSAKIETVIRWVAWIVFALGVVGLLIVAGRMMLKHKRGEGEEAASGLTWVLGGCIVAASAGALVGALA